MNLNLKKKEDPQGISLTFSAAVIHFNGASSFSLQIVSNRLNNEIIKCQNCLFRQQFQRKCILFSAVISAFVQMGSAVTLWF